MEGRMDCQSFREGCCGCCVNMRWRPERVRAFVAANTEAAQRIFPNGRRPRYRDLVRLHLARGGLADHLLMGLLAPLTLGLAAWLWQRRYGSCPFAGYLDEGRQRVGCLIHPLRVGEPDLRRHAFPLVPTLGCNRRLRCPLLDAPAPHLDADWAAASRAGYASLHPARRRQHA